MTLSASAARKLRKLIAYMKALPKKEQQHFDMEAWVTHEGRFGVGGSHGLKPLRAVPKKAIVQCGMAACALGWGCFIPDFKRAGLKLRLDEEGIARPYFGDAEGFEAAAEFFGISEQLAIKLFGNTDVKTPEQWAEFASKVLK